MLSKVKSLIDKYRLFEDSKRITVALSGGADSVCLLKVMTELKEEYSLELSAIHINHQLRAEESDRDEAFVKALCENLGIPLKVFKVDVISRASQMGESIELAARNIRYELFKEHSDGLVATAHNAGDNLETVLFNMARGSSLTGLCGIPVKRDIFIRPLLCVTRKEIEEYLSLKEMKFVVDSTNETDDYTRNRIRHNVVPTLKEINPCAETMVVSMCADIKEDANFLDNMASRAYLLSSKDGGIDAELLKIQHVAIIKRVLALYFKEVLNASPERLHIDRMCEVLFSEGKKSLPKNAFCKTQNGIFFIGNEEKESVLQEFITEIKHIEKINSLFLKNTIDCDKINGSLVIRTRLEGDKIRLLGRNCTKSLKKLFNELKIDSNIRDKLPVVSDDSGPVWVYGVGVDARVAVDENTKNAVEIHVKSVNKSNISGDVKSDR